MTRHFGRRAVKILIHNLRIRAGLDRWRWYVDKPDQFERSAR